MSHLLHSDTWDEEKLFSDFHRDGFVCVGNVLSTNSVHRALDGVRDVLNGYYDTDKAPLFHQDIGSRIETNRVGQIHWSNSAIFELACNSFIGEIVSIISGSNQIKLWGSQLYLKPSKQRPLCQIGFHRDSQHLPCFRKGCYTIWIPLVDINPDSGSIIYIKGSHQDQTVNDGLGADVPNVRDLIKSDFATNHEIIQAKAGDICIHHQDLIHGSMNNTSDKIRPAIALSVLSDDYLFNSEKDYYDVGNIISSSELVYIYGDSDV